MHAALGGTRDATEIGLILLTIVVIAFALQRYVQYIPKIKRIRKPVMDLSSRMGVAVQNATTGRDLTVLNVNLYGQERIWTVIEHLPHVLRCSADANPALQAPLSRLAKEFDRSDAKQSVRDMADLKRKLLSELPSEMALHILEEVNSGIQEREVGGLPAVLPYLCNRSTQSDAVHKTFRHPIINWARPVVLIVHGGKDELATGFVERLKHHTLVTELGSDDDPVNWARFHWPQLTYYKPSATPFDAFGASFRNIANCRFCSTLDQFSKAFIRPGINLIYSEVQTRPWTEKGEHSFKSCLQLWNQFPTLSSKEKLIICLTFGYPTSDMSTDGDPLESQICSSLNNLGCAVHPELCLVTSAEYSQLSLILLPPLESVSRAEVDEWTDETRVRVELGTEDRRLKLKTAVNALYQDCDRIAMVRLLPQLDSIIEQLI